MAECAFCACAGCVYFWCVALSLGLLQPLPRPVRERAGPDRCPVPCPSRSAVTGPHTAPHGARRGSISKNEDSVTKGLAILTSHLPRGDPDGRSGRVMAAGAVRDPPTYSTTSLIPKTDYTAILQGKKKNLNLARGVP